MSADVAHAELAVPKQAFRNLRLASYWFGIALASVLVFVARRHAMIGLASIAVAAFALQAAIASAMGVVLRRDSIDMPRLLIPVLPAIPFWRKRTSLVYVREATALGLFAGFEAVGLGTVDGAAPVLFSTRQAKLDFFRCLQAIKPDVKLYRAF